MLFLASNRNIAIAIASLSIASGSERDDSSRPSYLVVIGQRLWSALVVSSGSQLWRSSRRDGVAASSINLTRRLPVDGQPTAGHR